MTPEADRLITAIAALDNPHRLRIVAELVKGREYVSELSRRLDLSRPLLYLHLEKLAAAGFVDSKLELGADGKAVKFYELRDFDLRLTPAVIAQALAQPT
jgi:DNA-binding transcriptional ArsR family regulator